MLVFEGIIQSKQDVLDLVSIILNDAMVRHLLNNNNDTIHSKRPLNERERDVHVHKNRQRNVGRHRMLIQLHESEKEHSNRQRNLDRHRMPTLLHESEQEHSNRKRNETMEGVRIEKHAGGKDH